MAAGSGPIRTSVRPSTLSTVFFFTVLGLVPTVTGTTDTDTIADSLPGVQSCHLHGVPALPQLSAPSPPQLAPLSRRALQTVLSSATDFNRQLNDESVHSQLQQPHALSPPQLAPAPLTELESASSGYMEAVLARTKAEAAEDAAEAKLEAVLRALERGQPGSSGVKAE